MDNGDCYRKYVDRARAQNTFDQYVSGVWDKPKQLARSASFTKLTYYRVGLFLFLFRIVLGCCS